MGVYGPYAVMVLVSAFGAFIARQGFALWRHAADTRDGISVPARIEKLAYTGFYLTGSFYAVVSFVDRAGQHRAAEVGLMPVVWNRLRERQATVVSYSAANPQRIMLGGRSMNRIAAVGGIALMGAGALMAALCIWLIVAGVAGWSEVTPVP